MMKTLLIFSAKPSDPTLSEKYTRQSLQTIFPEASVEYSDSFDLNNRQCDDGFTLVIPGGYLPNLIQNLDDNGQRGHCIEAVKDFGANYIGFCAGAYVGADDSTAGKSDQPYYTFHRNPHYNHWDNYPMGMIENVHAVGPFLPSRSAQGALYKLYSHKINIQQSDNSHPSLYMEGPMFLDMHVTKPYSVTKNVLANYVFESPLRLKFIAHSHIYSSPELGTRVPAMIHDEVKVGGRMSQRYLIGFHPELAMNADQFVPDFEKTYCPEYAETLTSHDKAELIKQDTRSSNADLLKRTLKL